MVSVAKSFDAPIKVLFPTTDSARPFPMLGLGDIVIPGYEELSEFDEGKSASDGDDANERKYHLVNKSNQIKPNQTILCLRTLALFQCRALASGLPVLEALLMIPRNII